MALQQYLSQTEAPVHIPGSAPMFAYRVGEEEQAQSKARRREKKEARPAGWKDRYASSRSASPGPSSSGPAQPAQAEPAQAQPAQAQPAQRKSWRILTEEKMAEFCRIVEQDRVTCTESMWLSLAVRLCLLDQLTLPWYSRRVPQLRGIEKGSAEDRGKWIEKVASEAASRIEAAKVSEEWNREGHSPWKDRYARLYKKAQPKKAQLSPLKHVVQPAQARPAQAQPAQAQPAQAQPAQDRETWIQNNWANLKSGVKLRILSQSGVRPRL